MKRTMIGFAAIATLSATPAFAAVLDQIPGAPVQIVAAPSEAKGYGDLSTSRTEERSTTTIETVRQAAYRPEAKGYGNLVTGRTETAPQAKVESVRQVAYVRDVKGYGNLVTSRTE